MLTVPSKFLRKCYRKLHGNNAPRKWKRIDSCVAEGAGKWHMVHTSCTPDWPEPSRYGEKDVEFETLAAIFPELGVLEIPNGYVYGEDAWIYTSARDLLPEFSWHGADVRYIQVPRRFRNIKKLDGVCLSIASIWASFVYAHFVLDSLPRLKLFQDAGFSLDEVDHVYCTQTLSKHATFLFERLEIPESKIIWAHADTGLQAKTLLVPSYPGVCRNYQKWVVDYLRELVPFPQQAPTRRLFVTRQGVNRNPVNLERVHEIMRSSGFEIYNPANSDEQYRDFHEAEIVVGVHGSGLTNLVFCQPGTKVLELIPSDQMYPYFYTLSVAARLNYSYLLCQSMEHRKKFRIGGSPFDVHIDESTLEHAIRALVG